MKTKIFSIFLFLGLMFSAGSLTSCNSDDIIMVDELTAETNEAELRSSWYRPGSINALAFVDGQGNLELTLTSRLDEPIDPFSVTASIYFRYGTTPEGHGGISLRPGEFETSITLLSAGETHKETKMTFRNVLPGLSPGVNPLPYVYIHVNGMSNIQSMRQNIIVVGSLN
jgi:hypothetical protein